MTAMFIAENPLRPLPMCCYGELVVEYLRVQVFLRHRVHVYYVTLRTPQSSVIHIQILVVYFICPLLITTAIHTHIKWNRHITILHYTAVTWSDWTSALSICSSFSCTYSMTTSWNMMYTSSSGVWSTRDIPRPFFNRIITCRQKHNTYMITMWEIL